MLRIPVRALRIAVPALLTSIALVAAAAPPALADDRRVVVAVARPAMTAAAAKGAALPGETHVDAEVVFDLQDEQGATDLATAVSTPGSAQYRQFLQPADWIARFAPTQETVDAFVATAQEGGLTVGSVPASRLFVVVTGTVDQLETVFGTALRSYAVHGEQLVAPAKSVSLPVAAAEGVRTVVFDRPAMHSAAVAAKSPAKAVPCSTWWKQHTTTIPKAYGATTAPTALCGYTAKQLRAASGLRTSTLTGSGQTIAVIDAFGSPTIAADLATYSRLNNLPAASYSQSVPARSTWDTSNGCSPSGWAVEQTLDLEAAHAIAPRASLVHVGASDCGFGFDTAMSQVLDQRLATIVSNSWGGTGLDTYAEQAGLADQIELNVHQQLQAAAEGIGLYFASGDAGDDSVLFGERAVDFPSSSPWVTSVGGTTTALDRKNRVVFQTVWGDTAGETKRTATRWLVKPGSDFAGGAGGGSSSLFTVPAYQAGVVPASLSGGMRASTDVSALAAPSTGFAVGVTSGGHYRSFAVGGTSLATPIVAAQMALAQQQSGKVFGFVNPALYGSRASITDVRATTTTLFAAHGDTKLLRITTLGRDGSLKARVGYDLPTGLGVLTSTSLTALGRD